MARRLGTGIMAPKRELSDVTPVELAGAAAGRTRENNGLNAKEIVEVLSAAGIPPKRRRKENEKLLLVNLTTVLETRGWSNEKVTDDIVERCGPIRNWDAWADDVVVKALHEENRERGGSAQGTELTQTTITGQKMKPATQGAAVAQQQQQQPPPPPPQQLQPWWADSMSTCWKCGELLGQALQFGFEECLQCRSEC